MINGFSSWPIAKAVFIGVFLMPPLRIQMGVGSMMGALYTVST